MIYMDMTYEIPKGIQANSASIRKFLEMARDELQRRGWTRGQAKNADGQVCMVGALAMVWDKTENEVIDDVYCAATDYLSTKVKEITGDPWMTIVHFNDVWADDLKDVINAFEKTIADCP